MDLSTAFTIFIVLFFIEWLYTIIRCDNEALSTATNQTYLNYLDHCITKYSSKGLPYVIEIGFLNLQSILAQIFACVQWVFIETAPGVQWIFIETAAGVQWIFIETAAGVQWIFIATAGGVQWIFIETAAGVQWIFNNQSTVIIFMFSFISSYGAFNRQSDAFKTMLDVFNALREDLATAMMEIWSSLKNGLISLYRAITVFKVIEIVIVGLFLSNVPDVFSFLLKALGKVAKV